MQIECHIFAFKKDEQSAHSFLPSAHINMYIEVHIKYSLQVCPSPAVYEVLRRLSNQLWNAHLRIL